MKAKTAGLLGALLLSVLTRGAWAQEVDDASRTSARKLGYSGVEAYQAGDYAGASSKLERAYRVLQAPSLGLWSARALVKLGKLVEAQERYLKVGRLPIGGGDADVQRQAQADAATELGQLSPRVPYVILKVEGAAAEDVTISIDGVTVASDLVGEPRPVNPGAHSVVGTRAGERQQLSVEVAEAEQKPVVLRFAGSANATAAVPTAAVPPSQGVLAQPVPTQDRPRGSTQRLIGFVTLGVGGAGLLLGAVTGVVAMGKESDLSENPRCANNECGPSQQDQVDSYNSLRSVSTVGFIAGGVLAATGVVLVLTSPSRPASAHAALWLGPGSAGFKGAF
jgi:hypothetical protein